MSDRRKVLLGYGMSSDKMLFLTDAPSNEIISWCIRYLLSIDAGISIEFFDTLKTKYYVRELLDTALDGDFEDIAVIGYDEAYDLGEIYRILMEVCEEKV